MCIKDVQKHYYEISDFLTHSIKADFYSRRSVSKTSSTLLLMVLTPSLCQHLPGHS
jgi:hypothetical protein